MKHSADGQKRSSPAPTPAPASAPGGVASTEGSGDQWTLLAPAVMLAVPLLVELNILMGQVLPAGFSPGGSDLLLHELPVRKVFWESMRHGLLPTWTHLMYGGYPLLASLQSGMLAPLSYPPALLPLVSALGLFILLHRVVAVLSTYALARAIGQSRIGAFTAGLALAYSGFFVGHLMHLDVFATACFAPLVILGLLRAARGQGGLLLALALTYQLLSGSPQQTLLTIVFGAPLAVSIACLGDRARGPGGAAQTMACPAVRLAARRLVVPLALWPLLALPQLLPTAELVSRSDRGAALHESEILKYPFPPRALAGIFWPAATGRIADGSFPFDSSSGLWAETGVYAGVLAPWALLVVLCLKGGSGERASEGASGGAAAERRVAAAGLLALLVAMGGATPVGRIYAHVPILGVFRNITRPLFFLDLALALALGRVLTRLAGHRGVLVAGLLAVATIADITSFAYRERGDIPAKAFLLSPRTRLPWADRDLGPRAGMGPNGLGPERLAGSHPDGLLEVGSASHHRRIGDRAAPAFTPAAPPNRTFSFRAGVAFGKTYLYASDPDTADSLLMGARDLMAPEMGMLWDCATLGGFAGLADVRSRAVSEGPLIDDRFPDRDLTPLAVHLLQACGTRRLLLTLSPGSTSDREVARLQARRDITQTQWWSPWPREAWRACQCDVSGAAPFAGVVQCARWAAGGKAALARMAEVGFDPCREVILEGARPPAASQDATPPVTDCARTRPVRWEIFGAGTRILILSPIAAFPAGAVPSPLPRGAGRTQTTGYVVLTNTYDPGWSARCERGPLPVLRANFCTMAVPLDRPTRWVLLRYDPPGFAVGLAISGALLILLALWPAVRWRRRGSTQ